MIESPHMEVQGDIHRKCYRVLFDIGIKTGQAE